MNRKNQSLIAYLGAMLLGMLACELVYADDQRLYRSAYYLGRGDTGIADTDGAEAIYYNPAGLARGTGIYKETVLISPHLEFSKNSRDLYRQIAVEEKEETDALKKIVGKPQHLGVYNLTAIVFRRAALGALVSNQTDLLVSKAVENGGLETIEASSAFNQALTLSIAEQFFNEHLLLGVTGKYLNRGQGELNVSIIDAGELSELNQGDLVGYGSGTGADLGMMILMGQKKKFMTQHSLGVTVENVGQMQMKAKEESNVLDDMHQTVNVGYAASMGTISSRFKLLLDYRDATSANETNKFKKTHIGAELTVAELIGLTGGLNQGYPCAGIYLDIRFLRVDVGYYAEEVGERVGTYPDQRYFFRLKVGF